MTDDQREQLIQQIVARPYRKVISGDDDERYLAEAPELPGCVTAGQAVEEALEMLRDGKAGSNARYSLETASPSRNQRFLAVSRDLAG